MAKIKTIKVMLTDEQMEQLQPLFDEVERRPMEGFVIAQVWGKKHGMMVGFVTPDEVHAGMIKAIEKRDKRMNAASCCAGFACWNAPHSRPSS